MTAQIAREKAAELLLRVKNGEDPQEKKWSIASVKLWKNFGIIILFPFMFLNTEILKISKNNKTYWENDIKPKLGQRKLLDLTGKDFEILHMAKANTPYSANRMLALASVLCKLIRKERNLNISVEGIAHYPEEERQRILNERELDALKAELVLAMNRGKI